MGRADKRKAIKALYKKGYHRMLVNDETTWHKLFLEHEPGQWVRLRPLTAAEYQHCLDVNSDAVVQRFSKLDPAFFKSLSSDISSSTDNDTSDQIDVTTALQLAIKEWSYPVPCNDENKAALDAVASEVIKNKIIEMNKPRNLSNGSDSNGSLSLLEEFQSR